MQINASKSDLAMNSFSYIDLVTPQEPYFARRMQTHTHTHHLLFTFSTSRVTFDLRSDL